MSVFRNPLYLERRIDGSIRGMAFATSVARTLNAPLTVAGILGTGSGDGTGDGQSRLGIGVPGYQLRRRALIRRWEERLEAVVRYASEEGVRVHPRILAGELEAGLKSAVAERGHDLVLTVSDPERAPWPWQPRSTAERVLRTASCPVWLIHPAQGARIRVIVAAVECGEDCTEESTADRRVLRIASALARAGRCHLHVVHGWNMFGESILGSPLRGLRHRSVRELLERTRDEHRERMRALVGQAAPEVPVSLSLAKASAHRAVVRAARRREADVVVVGYSARHGLEGILFGNVAERIVGRVPSSILAVPTAEVR